MRLRAKVDQGQGDIVAALQRAGCLVESLARLGGGIPDLLVGAHGRVYLLEVKADKGALTPDQVRFHRTWRGLVHVVRTPVDALKVVLGAQS